MQPPEFWKNFKLGEELSISGTFIYNGLRAFHDAGQLDFNEDMFEVLYNLSVGVERLLKVAIVLLEHDEHTNQDQLEKSLITHNHPDLLARIKDLRNVPLAKPHNEFLALLARFYKTHRYDRFTLGSIYEQDKERNALLFFFNKHLDTDATQNDHFFGTPNTPQYQKFLRKITIKISSVLYEIINERAHELNINPHEMRTQSKAFKVFSREADLPAEDVLWKELLIFFMNTKESSEYLEFLRGIDPLDFDPGLIEDYLECFQKGTPRMGVGDELEHHYDELENKGERLRLMSAIGSPMYLPEDEQDEFDLGVETEN